MFLNSYLEITTQDVDTSELSTNSKLIKLSKQKTSIILENRLESEAKVSLILIIQPTNFPYLFNRKLLIV